jgi:hypothetical protein
MLHEAGRRDKKQKRNPKYESRNPKQIRNPKERIETALGSFELSASDLGFVSDFEFRASDFLIQLGRERQTAPGIAG